VGHLVRRGWRSLTPMLVVVLVVGTYLTAGAAPDQKSFETTITPSTATAGTPVDFTLTIANTSDPDVPLGAARITVPSGFTVNSVAFVGTPNWTLLSTDPIVIAANDSASRLASGQSISLTIDAVTPLQNGDQSYDFAVDARQANNFNGKKNDLSGTGAAVLVTGSAVACEQGVSCSTGHDEAGTNVDVTTTCAADAVECANLVVDLDENCLGQECAGLASFWVPPTENSAATVEVVLTIPKSAFGGDGAGQVQFFVAPTGAAAAFECGTNNAVLACDYKVKPVGNSYEITATVAQVDPRGFAS
jgi:hypothetical protein